MKLSIIIPVLNQYKMTAQAVNYIAENVIGSDVELLLIDNASDEGGKRLKDAIFGSGIDTDKIKRLGEFRIVDNASNIGTYATFKEGLKHAKGDILCYLHSDVFIYENGWDKRVVDSFEKNQKLGLVGFVGSCEIDGLGGRGCGTASNFRGRQIGEWRGSPAEAHGKRISGLMPAAVVDGCVMILRRSCLQAIENVVDFPHHHFYDRLISCQVLEAGWNVAVLGIAFDHFGGQTVCREGKHQQIAEKKMVERFGSRENWSAQRRAWMMNSSNPSKGKQPDSGDYWTYLEAEWRFLSEWREQKRFIPLKVNNDYSIQHYA